MLTAIIVGVSVFTVVTKPPETLTEIREAMTASRHAMDQIRVEYLHELFKGGPAGSEKVPVVSTLRDLRWDHGRYVSERWGWARTAGSKDLAPDYYIFSFDGKQSVMTEVRGGRPGKKLPYGMIVIQPGLDREFAEYKPPMHYYADVWSDLGCQLFDDDLRDTEWTSSLDAESELYNGERCRIIRLRQVADGPNAGWITERVLYVAVDKGCLVVRRYTRTRSPEGEWKQGLFNTIFVEIEQIPGSTTAWYPKVIEFKNPLDPYSTGFRRTTVRTFSVEPLNPDEFQLAFKGPASVNNQVSGEAYMLAADGTKSDPKPANGRVEAKLAQFVQAADEQRAAALKLDTAREQRKAQRDSRTWTWLLGGGVGIVAAGAFGVLAWKKWYRTS